jgi:fructokinase
MGWMVSIVYRQKSVQKFGAIEAGGTKWVCGIGSGPDDLVTTRIDTGSPKETIDNAVAFFRGRDLAAIGIGSFGPVNLDRASPHYGYITTTPKRGWQNTDVAGAFRAALKIPVGFDTDVNAAALGESRWGAARDVASCIYLTIGTGVGGGAILDGRLLHGLMHPEMGHIRIPHDRQQDPFPGACPFHGDCLEGLASGPAIQKRWGAPAKELPSDHPAWQLEARYLALAVANFVFTVSPARVILGGGVMDQAQLFGMIRAELSEIVNGYIQLPEHFVVAPGLGNRSGILGALALAELVVE